MPRALRLLTPTICSLWFLAAFLIGCDQRPAAPAPAPRPPATAAPAPPRSSTTQIPKPTVPTPPVVTPAVPTPPTLPTGDFVRIEKFWDGDSMLLVGGKEVRLIGVDTPEKDQPFADDAREFSRSILDGKDLRLEQDEEKTDDYGRILAYVYAIGSDGGETFANLELLRAGLARVYTHRLNIKYVAEFVAAQAEAIEGRKGQWASEPEGDEGFYISSYSGYRFHRPNCQHVKDISEGKRKRHESRWDVLKEGKSPCRACKP